MFEQLLVAAALLQSFALLGALRRRHGRGYLTLLVGVLGVLLLALARGDAGLGLAGLVLAVASAGLPWVLEKLSRRLFERGMISWSVRLASLRALLMPGAGLGRQQALLAGLDLLEAEGPEAALRHFQTLAAETEDEAERAALDEQIISTLLYGRRWNEAIAHFERRFHRGYAALRPSLALGLLRAYGEAGRLVRAAQLLRAMEEAPIGRHPQGASAMILARMTFLAYAGAAGVLDEVVPAGAGERAGLSAATGAYFHGVALARSGQPRRAAEVLARVEELAGPGDRRLVAASHEALEQVSRAAVIDLDPEVRRYVQHSAGRLLSGLRSVAATAGPRGWLAPPLLVVLSLLAYLARLVWPDLLAVGAASSTLVQAGSWSRLLVAPWLHADPAILIIDVYALWYAARILQRRLGAGLVLLGALVAGTAATTVSVISLEPGALVGGVGPIAVALLVGALVASLPTVAPMMDDAQRRSVLGTLVILLGLQALLAWPGLRGLDQAAVAYAVGIGAGLLLGPWPPLRRRGAERVLAGLGLASVLGLGLAAGHVAREDVGAYLAAHPLQTCEVRGARVNGPGSLRARTAAVERETGPASLPAYPGLVDDHAARLGARVQLVHVDASKVAAIQGGEGLAFDPQLRRRFSATRFEGGGALERALEVRGIEALRLDLRADGATMAGAVLRPLEDGSGLLLLAEPATALDYRAQAHAALLASGEALAGGSDPVGDIVCRGR